MRGVGLLLVCLLSSSGQEGPDRDEVADIAEQVEELERELEDLKREAQELLRRREKQPHP